jgi:hypothetical protein
MKTTGKVLLAVLAVAGTLAVSDVWAQSRGGGGGGGRSGGSMSGGSARGAAWSGGSHGGGGHYSGGSRYYSGGSHGGHYYHGGGYYRPYYYPSFYWGLPLWGAAWWGYPYYNDYYYPRSAVVYDAPPQSAYPEYYMPPATTEVPQGEGAPNQGPLYMNYCESAKAYFPKVASCPEGWKFIAPQR